MLLAVDQLEIINKSLPKAEGKITRKEAKAVHKDLPPNGHWVTIRGHHVYIVDGKVVAGSLPWVNKKGEVKAKKATKEHLKEYQKHIDRQTGKSSEEKTKKTSKKKAETSVSEEKPKKTTRKTTTGKKAEPPALVVEAPKKTTKKKTSEAKTVEEKIAQLYENDPAASAVSRQSPRLAYLKQYYNSLLPKRLTKPHKKLKELIDNASGTSELNRVLSDVYRFFSTVHSKEDYKRMVAHYEDVLRSEQMRKKQGKAHNVFEAERDLKFIKDHPELADLSAELKEHFHPAKRKQVLQEALEYVKKFRQEAEEQSKSVPEDKKSKKTTKKKTKTKVEEPAPASEEKPKAEPEKPAKKMNRKEVIHELQNVFGLQDLRKEAPDVAERRVFGKLRQYGLMEKCEKCGGTGETPAGLLCPKCYGEGVQYPKLTAELVERAKEKVGEQKSAPASEAPKKPAKVEKITATDAKKLMGKQVPVRYRDALLDTLQHEEQTFKHRWSRYSEGFATESNYKVLGRLYKKHEVEEAIQRYKNDPKFRSEVQARVHDKEKAEKDAFEADVKEFMDELRKHHLNDSSIEFEVGRRLNEELERERASQPKKEESRHTGGLDDLFGDYEDLDAFFNDLMSGKLTQEDEERKKKREEIRRQVIKEAEDRLKEYEDLLRERLTSFHEAKKKKKYKSRYDRMSDEQIRHEMNKIARDYALPYGHRLLKRYMIAKQTGRDDWKM